MTVYSRSDHVAVNIPTEAFGGCGNTHIRPVSNGAPVKIWGLECPDGCEEYLRHDPSWSTNTVEIPETYDETKRREQAEKSGKMDRERQLAEALIQLGPLGDLPRALGEMLAQLTGSTPPDALAGNMECPQGHGQPAGRKFCAECGSPMHGTPAAAAIEQPAKATEPPAQKVRLQDLTLPRLQKLARDRQMDSEGTRSDLIARLRAAGVKNSDLAAPVAA